MSDVRLVRWVLVGLSVALGAIACVDGSVPSNQGPSASMIVAGASGTGNPLGAGASGMGTVADGSCKDTLSDPAHCGTCATACAQGQICDQGVCKAPVANCTAPQVACNGVCADLTSPAHCGTCETRCVTGQTCTAGACACDGALLACNGACVDAQTSSDNCGGCNKPCATGAVCTAGVCGCAAGQTQCNGTCLDLTSSAANCGACGTACKTGETCSSSTCVTGAGADGCSGGPALGISLKSIDVYQSVKVPVMTAGAEITTDKRTTDIVTGRPTMFRLSVALASGFTARQLSARITLNNGSTASQYFVKQAVSKDSVDGLREHVPNPGPRRTDHGRHALLRRTGRMRRWQRNRGKRALPQDRRRRTRRSPHWWPQSHDHPAASEQQSPGHVRHRAHYLPPANARNVPH